MEYRNVWHVTHGEIEENLLVRRKKTEHHEMLIFEIVLTVLQNHELMSRHNGLIILCV